MAMPIKYTSVLKKSESERFTKSVSEMEHTRISAERYKARENLVNEILKKANL